MSGPFGSSQWMYNSGADFYNGIATQSLRLNPADTLTENYGTPTSSTIMSFGGWVKRLKGGHYSNLYSSTLGGAGVEQASMYFDTDDKFKILSYTGSSYVFNYITTRLFRDFSSWYHIWIQIDTTDATQDDRVKIWINGIRETSFSTETKVGSGSPNVSGFNSSGKTQYFGHTNGSYGGHVYYSDWYFIDGSAVSPVDTVGEFKNGVFIAKRYSPTFGNNGWHLEFNQTGTGTASSSTIGADTSGNDNHFSSSGIVASDCDMPDSPENNFATFNSVGRRYGQSYVATFSEGNLKAVGGGNATNVFGSMAINQIASQGGVYFEIRMDSLDTSRTYFGVVGDTGVNNQNASSNSGGYTFPIKGMINNDPRGDFATVTDASVRVDLTANTAFSNGDVAGIAILSDGKFFCHRNGTYLQNASGNVGNPSTGANPIATIDLTLGDWVAYVGYNSSFSINFGQDGSFSGNETSGGYQDGNGIGDFMFAVPTNCFAICTSNMAEPTISPNADTQADDYFNTVLYTGNGSTQSINVGFAVDFAWLKRRDSAGNHFLLDTVRGATKQIYSDLTLAEETRDSITSFSSTGYDLGNYVGSNGSAYSMVAWNWKAGGTAVSNTDGSITSSVSANTDAGFSIVSYTGTDSATETIGHGLGSVPAMLIIKSRDSALNWAVYHKGSDATAPEDYLLRLNTTDARADVTSAWNDTAPTSSVFTVGTSSLVNNTDDFIAYCFAEIDGYSKFGSYTGNGSTDGTFVYTGFRPAWVMFKKSSSADGWLILDTARNTFNVTNSQLFAQATNAESSISPFADFTANGFKLRDTGGLTNSSGGTYIYMSFAENPFKYANAR